MFLLCIDRIPTVDGRRIIHEFSTYDIHDISFLFSSINPLRSEGA